MTEIQYVVGNATEPIGDGPKIICHVVNTYGYWAKGFVLAVSAKWKEPEAVYRKVRLRLGEVQFVIVENNPLLIVANMCAQEGIRGLNKMPLKLPALNQCLHEVAKVAKRKKASIHCPRVGCGLAGSSWDKVEPLVQTLLAEENITVTVYDLPPAVA